MFDDELSPTSSARTGRGPADHPLLAADSATIPVRMTPEQDEAYRAYLDTLGEQSAA